MARKRRSFGRRNAVGGSGEKYGNQKIVSDGQVFDSKREYRRWCELKLLEKAGEIWGLERQVKFVLIPAQHEYTGEVYKRGKHKGELKPGKCIEREVTYIADFVYFLVSPFDDCGMEQVVEDCKGMRTTDYVIKRKLMLFRHGIRIKET